jgi:hypothetical protein
LVEVPRVDGDAPRVRVLQEGRQVVVVGLALGERVEQRDVDVPVDRAIGVDLDHLHPIGVRLEHPSDAEQDDLEVVDEGQRDGGGRRHLPKVPRSSRAATG